MWYTKKLATTLASTGTDVTVIAERLGSGCQEYSEDGVQVIRSWRYGLRATNDVLSTLRVLHPSVIHLQHELFMFGPRSSAAVPPLLVEKLRRIAPLVTSVHGVAARGDLRGQFAKAYCRPVPPAVARHAYGHVLAKVVSGSDLVITHSPSLLGVVRSYAEPRRVAVVPLGIDRGERLSRQRALSEFGIPDRVRAVFFGFTVPYKGIETLEAAAPLLAEEGVEVLIAGGASGDPAPTTARPQAGNAGASAVRRLGYIEEEALPALFSLTDVLVLPYRVGLSASGPLSLAASYRTPVVVSDVPTLADTLKCPEVTFPRGDSRLLADRVLSVVKNRGVREAVLARLTDLAARHSWEAVAATCAEQYRLLSNDSKYPVGPASVSLLDAERTV